MRAVRASSNAALERTLCTHAGAPESVPSTSSTETAASTVDCSAAYLWAWNRIVRECNILYTYSCGYVIYIDMVWCLCYVFVLSLAVQCERKPVEVTTREKSVNCAASTEKIYIRKNLCSPLAATPTFMSDKETARYSHFTKYNTLIYQFIRYTCTV